jgi:hypothetical protein
MSMAKWYVGFSVVFFLMMGVIGWYANKEKTRPIDTQASTSVSPTMAPFANPTAANIVYTRAFTTIAPRAIKPTLDSDRPIQKSSTVGEEPGINTLVVIDQIPQGMMRIPHASISQFGYVVIHADADGPGEIIGTTSLVPPGDLDNIDIPLSRDAVDGEVLYAVIHANMDEQDDLTDADVVALNSDGSAAMASFRITSTAVDPYAQ